VAAPAGPIGSAAAVVIGNEHASVSKVVTDNVYCDMTGLSAAAAGAKTAVTTAATKTTSNVGSRFISPHLQ
jgi:hypothetical protein